MISRFVRYFRKPLAILVIIVVSVVFVSLALRSYYIAAGKKELEKALAETAQIDPGWRLDELEQKRLILKDEDNSATQLLKACNLIPQGWWSAGGKLAPNGLRFINSCGDLPAEEKLSNWQTAELKERLHEARFAVKEARKLATYSSGRFPLNTHQTLIVSAQSDKALWVSMLLELDCMLLAGDEKIDLALLDARGILEAGRSIGDEPVDNSQIRRMTCSNLAVRCIERALAQGQASDHVLAQLQRLLEQEEAEPIFHTIARAQRAWWHQTMVALEAGDIEIGQIIGEPVANPLPFDILQVYTPTLPLCHAWILRFMNKYVEIAKGPSQGWCDRGQELVASIAQAPRLANVLLKFIGQPDHIIQTARSVQHSRALLRCAIVAIALERHRLSSGSWPDSLSELAPEFVHQLPTDPFDGDALRYRRTENGVIVYSLGGDKKDDGGIVQKRSPDGEVFESTDLGFRLWNVENRRQPPRQFNGGKEPEAINKINTREVLRLTRSECLHCKGEWNYACLHVALCDM